MFVGVLFIALVIIVAVLVIADNRSESPGIFLD